MLFLAIPFLPEQTQVVQSKVKTNRVEGNKGKVAEKNCKWMICERFLKTPSSLTGQVSFVRKGKTRNVIDVSAHISRTNLENAIDPRPYVHCFGHPGGRADSLSWAA